jgi:rhodanese-related sulfurtransferase
MTARRNGRGRVRARGLARSACRCLVVAIAAVALPASATSPACAHVEAPVAVIAPPPELRDTTHIDTSAMHCLVNAADLISGRVQARLVDVREAANAAHLHIPAAVRLRPGDIPTSAFLARDESIALLGAQSDTLRLLHLCRRLRADGWRDVRLVRGGVRAWHAQGGAIEGDIASLETPERIDAAMLFEVLGSKDAVVLAPIATLLPAGTRATVLPDNTESIAHLSHARATAAPALIAIIGDAASSDATAYRRRFRQAHLPEPVVYADGLAELDAWIARHAGIRASADTRPTQACRWN